jgi:hypothetical protein
VIGNKEVRIQGEIPEIGPRQGTMATKAKRAKKHSRAFRLKIFLVDHTIVCVFYAKELILLIFLCR